MVIYDCDQCACYDISMPKREVTLSFIIAGLCLVVLIGVLFFTRNVPQQISGEAFYDLHYADRHSWQSGWQEYLANRVKPRVMAAVYFSGIYELVGYNPPVLFLTSYLQIVGIAIMLGLMLESLLRKRVSAWLIGLSVLAFALLPINFTNIFAFKKAFHVFAWFALAVALFSLHQWIKTKQAVWLLPGTVAYLISINSYEATFALLPVALFLSAKDLRSRRESLFALLSVVGITLLGILSLFYIESLSPGGNISELNDPTITGGVLNRLILLFVDLPSSLLSTGTLSPLNSVHPAFFAAMQILAISATVIAVVGVFLAIKQSEEAWRDERLLLAVSGLWLVFGGYFSFAMAGILPDEDGLYGASFGIIFVAAAASLTLAKLGRKRVGEILVATLLLGIVVSGFDAHQQGLLKTKQSDSEITTFVLTLRKQIPGVKEGTEFIFVNSGLGRTGCIGAMNMIFGRDRLHCIHLFDGDTEETYIRHIDSLEHTNGRTYPNEFIILTIGSNGEAIILTEISPVEYPDLPVTWLSTKSIETDFSVILRHPKAEQAHTEFYDYSVNLAKYLKDPQ